MNKSALTIQVAEAPCRGPLLLQRPLQNDTSGFKLMSCHDNRPGIQVVFVFESVPYGQ